MATTNTTRTLISTTIFAALILTGCNRALPTEPQNSVTEVPDFQAASGASEAGATSSRTRPTRTSSRPSAPVPQAPASDPSTEPVPPTTPPPTPPTPTVSYDCHGACDNVLRVPSEDAYMAAVYAARDRVRSAVASGEIKAKNSVRNWNVVPSIEWKACYFWVANGFYYDAQGNRQVGGCAAGMTDYSHKKIVISTKEEPRTLALVKWEATNYYLYLIGRTDLLDRFQ
jgi:hypothetical protein